MAVLSRLLFNSSQRLDVPDLLSIDSAVSSDFKFFLNGLVGTTTPYILKGFDVIDPASSIGGTSISVRVADSVVYCPSMSSGSFFHGLEEGNAAAEPLVPELRKSATNYVYLTVSSENNTQDLRAFWDPDAADGEGDEFTQDIDTKTALVIKINVSTSTFPTNSVPVCKVVYGATTITSIEDCRELLFRLGSGGANPDPNNSFTFRSLPTSDYARAEPTTIMSSSSAPNSFQGGDKNIRSLKEWMDAVMTRIRELSGSTTWYAQANNLNFNNLFIDSAASIFKSKGTWSLSSDGLTVSWSEDLIIRNLSDPREIVITGPGSKAVGNDLTAFIELIRDEVIPSALNVTWTLGSATITGVNGTFSGLVVGDWIRKNSDNNYQYFRILSINGTNSSATIDRAYDGTTETAVSVYTKGTYSSSDVQIGNRTTSDIFSLGGNFFWLATNSDTQLKLTSCNVSTISVTWTNPTTSHNGIDRVKGSATAHGLQDGDTIYIQAISGTRVVEVIDANSFYVTRSGATLTGTSNVYITVATIVTRSSSSLQLENADAGNIEQYTVTISGTTNFNGSKLVHQRSQSVFTFAPPAAGTASESSLSSALLKIHKIFVRTELGSAEVTANQTINVSNTDSYAVRTFVGMKSQSDTAPDYSYVASGNDASILGAENYNAVEGESLVARAARNTAAIADARQDMNITWDPGTIGWDGTTITLTGASVSIPGVTVGSAVQGINSVSTALPSGSALCVFPDRNAAATLSAVVKTLDAVQPYPNLIVLIRNIGGTLIVRP